MIIQLNDLNELEIDNSQIMQFLACERSYNFKYRKMRELVKPSHALNFGTAVHKALAIYYSGNCASPDLEKITKSIVDHYTGYDCCGDYRDSQFCQKVVFDYIKKYGNTDAVDKTLEVERGFSFSLGNFKWALDTSFYNRKTGKPVYLTSETLPVVYTGRIDRVYEDNGQVTLMDHKTTSIGGDVFAPYYISNQMKGYIHYLQNVRGISNDIGVVMNYIIARAPTKTGKNVEYVRSPLIKYHQKDLTTWYEVTLKVIKRMLDTTVPIFNSEHCVGKYGKCGFYDVCSLPETSHENMLSCGLFKPFTWSPLDEDK